MGIAEGSWSCCWPRTLLALLPCAAFMSNELLAENGRPQGARRRRRRRRWWWWHLGPSPSEQLIYSYPHGWLATFSKGEFVCGNLFGPADIVNVGCRRRRRLLKSNKLCQLAWHLRRDCVTLWQIQRLPCLFPVAGTRFPVPSCQLPVCPFPSCVCATSKRQSRVKQKFNLYFDIKIIAISECVWRGERERGRVGESKVTAWRKRISKMATVIRAKRFRFRSRSVSLSCSVFAWRCRRRRWAD